MASPIQIQQNRVQQSEKKLNPVVDKPIYYEKVFYSFDCMEEKYTFLSPSVKSLIGYTPEELNEIGLQNIIVEKINEHKNIYEDRESTERLTEENVTTYLLTSSDGEPKWIEDSSITIIDNIQQTKIRVGFLCDVSIHIKDDKLRKIIADILEISNSEKNINDVFEFIHASIKKLMKADNFYIAYFNKDSNTLSFPYFVDEYDDDSSSKKLGKGLTEFVLRNGKSELVDKKRDRELILAGESELLGPQSEIWLGVPLKIKDKTIGVLVLQDYKDPTTYTKEEQQILDVISYPISRAIERKIVEEERNEMIIKLQELNKSKDNLFSLISNDLRTPFNSLLGFADVLTNEFDSLTQRDIKEYLKVINDSSKTLFWMTNNLLHYSRMQLGKFEYEPQTINLEDAVRISAQHFKKNIAAKDLVVKNNVSGDIFVYADSAMLTIILNNLLSNAIKFSHNGGAVNVSTEEIDGEGESQEIDLIRIIIKDAGTGITEENQERLKNREMFSTLGTSKEFGTGLGLLLVRDMLEINKGTLFLQSEVDRGTSVIITLPVVRDVKTD